MSATHTCCECKGELRTVSPRDVDHATQLLAEHDWVLSATEGVLRPLCRACALEVYGEDNLALALAAIRGAS